MKLSVAALACFCSFAASTALAADLSASEIADKNVAARGGLQAWRAVTSMTMAGDMEAGGKENTKLPFTWTMKRPHKSRLEIKFQDQTAVQVFDGVQGWKVRPFLNRNEVEPYSTAEARQAAVWQELDGPLVDFAKKGTKVELAGRETVGGRDNYRLKLTFAKGPQRYLWVDAGTFLETKIDGEPRKMDGRVRKVTVYYRDYKQVNGLAVPHTLETVVDGVKPTHKISIQNVAINKPIEDSMFSKSSLVLAKATVKPTK
jgi:hypothetical protein